MALVFADFVKDTTTTTGTGTYTLSNTAPTGFQTFGTGIGNGNQTCYAVTDGTDWETGNGTYTSAGTTLSRDTITSSSNGGAAVNWGAGTRTIYCDMPANRGQGTIVSLNSQSSGYTLLAADFGRLVKFTGSSDQTFAFTAAAALGNGWWCYLQNAGASQAAVILDANGAETIDGLTSYKMYPGEVRLVQCTGSAFNTAIVNPFTLYVTAAGAFTFTTPPGYVGFDGLLWGGGGGGGSGTSSGGGGGAACVPFDLLATTMGSSQTVTVGATASAGVAGNSSTIGSLVTARGGGLGGANGGSRGGGGGGGGALAVGGNGGNGSAGAGGSPLGGASGTTGTDNSGFGGAGAGSTTNPSKGGNGAYGGGGGGGGNGGGGNTGGGSVYGGGGGGGNDAGTSAAGGSSVFGGPGGTGNGSAGTAPGGGGGANGGTGAQGGILIRGH